MSEDKYKLTPEHLAQTKSWADRWVAVTQRCETLSDEERGGVREAVRGLYVSSYLPPPVNVVLADGPVSGAIATGVAAGVWYLRDHPEIQQSALGCEIDEERLTAAISGACRYVAKRVQADLRGKEIADDDEALRVSIESSTRAALEAAAPSTPISKGTAIVIRALTRAVEVSIIGATVAANKVAIEAAAAAATIVASDRAIASALAPDGSPDLDALYARAAVIGVAVSKAIAEAFRDGSPALARRTISAAIDDAIRSDPVPAERPLRWFESESAGYAKTAAVTGSPTAADRYVVTELKEHSKTPNDPAEVVGILAIARDHALEKDSRAIAADALAEATCRTTIVEELFARTKSLINDAIVQGVDLKTFEDTPTDVENSVRDVVRGKVHPIAVHLSETARSRDSGTFVDDPVVRFLIRCCGASLGIDYNTHGDAANISFYRHVAKLPVDFSAWANYETIAAAGPRFFCKKFCIVSDHPLELRVTESRGVQDSWSFQGTALPHSSDGPSFRWRDGFFQYHWRNVAVPQTWIENPESIDIRDVIFNAINAEKRRVVVEILGWAKILDSLKARVVDENPDPEIGTLLETDWPVSDWSGRLTGEMIVAKFLRVRCATKREFVLPVPREMTTALQANAWTYNVTEDQLLKLEART